MKKVQWTVDYQHILIAVVAALAGGATGYFAQHDPVALLSSFGSWATAKPIVFGLVYAEIIALLALAKKSPIEKTPDAPPPVPGKVEFLHRSAPPPPMPQGGAVISNMPSSFPKSRRTMLTACLLAACMPLLGGCNKLWTDFKNNPVQMADQFVSFVESFLQGAATMWSMIGPFLGGGSPAATAIFDDVMMSAHNALGLLLDAVHAATELNTPAPDFSKLIADVKDAIARVMATIAQYKTVAASARPSIGAAHDTLAHQAAVIAAWRR